MMGAIGTLVSSVVALTLGLIPHYTSWRSRPMISVWPEWNVLSSDVYTSSIGFINSGKTTALDVHFYIQSIYEDKTKVDSLELVPDSALRYKVGNIQNGQKIEKGLVRIEEGDKYLQIFDDEYFEIKRTDFIVTLLITGDNFRAFSMDISFFDSIALDACRLVVGRSLPEYQPV